MTDVRAQLPTSLETKPGVPPATGYFELSRFEPSELSQALTPTWYVRSDSCCVAYSIVSAGDELSRSEQADEYMVVFPGASTSAEVRAGEDVRAVDGETVAVVPAGDSTIRMKSTGVVVRIFSNSVSDLLPKCLNAASHEGRPVHPYQTWPESNSPGTVKVYALADIPDDSSRFGRIFRCSTVMANVLPATIGPRDLAKRPMKPHHHDEFEQISLQLDGDFLHHMRTPWIGNRTEWRDDEHVTCESPAIVVIPRQIQHGLESVGPMRHQLLDIFAPPRIDFSTQPGWVLNGDDYPMP
jgi:hypothetical protein